MLSNLFKNVALLDQTQVFDFQSMKRSLGRGLEELMKTSRATSKAEGSSQEVSDSRLGGARQRIVVHPKGAFPG